MNPVLRTDVLTVVGLGVIAGMRSVLPTAALRASLGDGFKNELPWPVSALFTRGGNKVLSSAALGELAADKAPGMPDRTAMLPLMGRMLSGAIAGFVTARRRHRSVVPFACLGAASAVVGAFASHRLRQLATERLALPSSLVGLVEDSIAVGMSRSLAGKVIA